MGKKYILNLGLAFTLLYAGIGSFLNPQDWVWYVPDWVTSFGVSKEFALHGHAVAEIVLAMALIINFKVRWAAALVALDMLVITIASGIDVLPITFRDIGLLCTALYLALASWSFHGRPEKTLQEH